MTEVKVMVEYIIEMPEDIIMLKVDDYIKNEIDEGADSDNIKSRIVTDVSLSDRPGIVDKFHIAHEALDSIDAILHVHKTDGDKSTMGLDDIEHFVTGAMDVLFDNDEDDGE